MFGLKSFDISVETFNIKLIYKLIESVPTNKVATF